MNDVDRFRDRADAGRRLARRLETYADRSDVVVLALPRGGVPVGREIADALDLRRYVASRCDSGGAHA